jgi:diguanylate cyclase (GGDEF)-like protein
MDENGFDSVDQFPSKHSILLVDPYENLLQTYRLILEGEEYRVETARNLDEAFRRIVLRRYSVVITEYFQPFEQTAGMIQWLKEKFPEAYLMVITDASIDDPTYQKLFAIGLDDLILKPFSPERILAHIRKGLERREIIIKNWELGAQSVLDPITYKVQPFVFNSAYFMKYLRQEWKRAQRHKHSFSLLLVQIPTKEKIGDRFESFYTELAKILRVCTREEDFVGREDGHFGVLLPETDEVGSQALIERLNHFIQNHPVFQSDQLLKPVVQGLTIESFTYPEKFSLPRKLNAVLQDS